MADLVSERIIEDILSTDKSILAEILHVDAANLELIARQKVLPSGKLDLLYLCDNQLLLIELKSVGFYDEIVNQINAYHEDLKGLQTSHRLIDVPIRKVVLVPSYAPEDARKCTHESIELFSFDLESVLTRYYENFRELTYFLRIQSADFGVVRLGMLNSTLKLLSKGRGVKQIVGEEGRSEKSIRNRLSVAAFLGLVTKFRHEYFLTDLGNAFVEQASTKIDDRLSERQIELLSDFIKETPFYSQITYTIFAMVETVFVLAKNGYPVPEDQAQDYFVRSVGKSQTWKAARARKTATYIFSNYACELQLLAKVNNHFYITPKGIQAVLLLQLNRSIKLIESHQ